MAKRIFVNKNGDLTGLYDEKFGNIAEFGHRTIQRVSEVEFDNERQQWRVDIRGDFLRIPHDLLTHSLLAVAWGSTREEALAKEKEIVESKLKEYIQNG